MAMVALVIINDVIYLYLLIIEQCLRVFKGLGGSMSYVVGLPSNSYKHITNTVWVRARLCKLQKWCTRLTAACEPVACPWSVVLSGYSGSGFFHP